MANQTMTVMDNSYQAKSEKLWRDVAEAYSKLPLPIRIAYRVWCRLNRRKWQRGRQAELDRQRESLGVAMAAINRDLDGR